MQAADNGKRRQRHLTITFDDGLVNGARKAVELLDAVGMKATFYVVTGWIRPRRVWRVRDRFNRNRDHGSWADWQNIAALGHDIGSHTVSHINASGRMARYLPGLLRREIKQSFSHIQRHIGTAPRSISMPWNAASLRSESYVRSTYAACRLGSSTIRFNDCRNLQWHGLHSWAPDSGVPLRTLCDTVAGIPQDHWLILQFHSLDGEGHMPISSEAFAGLLGFMASQSDLGVRTVAEMVDLYSSPSGVAERSWRSRNPGPVDCP